MGKPVLVIHGGAGVPSREEMTQDDEKAYRDGLAAALTRGFEVLARGGASVDAVQAAVESLEDSPLFNAGRGAVFTSAGTHELDAAIMDGRALRAGAVVGVERIKNPIALARLVMDRSTCVMLAGAGAEAFAAEQGVAFVSRDYFWTERRWASLQRLRETRGGTARGGTGKRSAADEHGTVGAVALDVHGNLAAATSTGGLTGKRPGRVGDTPVIGAGTYATRRCAVSMTGPGEWFIRYAAAHDICARIDYKDAAVADAAHAILAAIAREGAEGGTIAVTADGDFAMPFTGEGMFRGAIGRDGTMTIGIHHDARG